MASILVSANPAFGASPQRPMSVSVSDYDGLADIPLQKETTSTERQDQNGQEPPKKHRKTMEESCSDAPIDVPDDMFGFVTDADHQRAWKRFDQLFAKFPRTPCEYIPLETI